MKLLGLTGGVGMGKSTTARFFQELGLPVVDTDQLARDLTEPGQPALDAIIQHFGAAYLDPAGRLRRGALAALVFADPQARRRLEEILHPPIRAAWQAEVERWRAAGHAAGVVVIPLLYETGAEKEVDCVVCVACGPEEQAARLAARGWAGEHWRRRVAAQWAIGDKMDRAAFVIWTGGTLAAHRAQAGRVVARV